MNRLVATAAAVLLCVPAFAADIAVTDVYARAVPATAMASAAYMTIENHAATPDRLIGARADVSKKVELHTHIVEDGVAKMRPVEAIEAPAHGAATLAPGGLHVMFLGLEKAFSPGVTFPLTLVFEKAGEVTVEVEVRDLSAGPQDAPMEGHGAATN